MSHEPNQSASCEITPPVAGGATTPMWLVVLAAVVFYSGLIYLDRNGGDFNAKIYAPYQNAEQLASYQPMEKVDPLFRRGEQLYAMACAVCHQPTGMGAPGQCPPLAGSEWVLQKDPARIIRLPLLGAGGPITVKGQDLTPSVVMPPLASVFPTDEDEAAVLTYIRQSWGNQAPAVTAEQVKKVKAEIGDRKDPWTSAELLKVPVTE